MKNALFLPLALLLTATAVFAQPRPADRTPTVTNVKAAYGARYEGGIFGRTGRETGTLRFDDGNERVVFHRGDNKEMFSIPYSSLLVVYPDSKKSSTKTGNVVSHLPLPGAGLAGLMSKRSRYLIIDYDDPDVDVRGTANFKFDDKSDLLDFINALGAKAKLVQRGDAYYRPKRRAEY